MDPSAPYPVLFRRAVSTVRASLAPGGASLFSGVGLLFAYELATDDEWPTSMVLLWVACNAVFGALGARYGFPDRPRGVLHLAGRTVAILAVGTVVYGCLLVPAFLWIDVASRWPYLLMVLALLVVFAVVSAPAPRIEAGSADGPGGLLPPAPPKLAAGPAATVPPLSPEEAERDDLVVEVRVLWGNDVLVVHHLDPPRSFYVGDVGADLAVDPDRLGAPRVPLVLVTGGRVTAVAPRGERFGAGERIALEPGAKVILTLPSRAAGMAYRGSEGADAEPVPIRIEVALVNAGRVVGRELSVRGAGRLLASMALAATVVLGPLAFAASQPVPVLADDPASREDILFMQRLIFAGYEREEEIHPRTERLYGGVPYRPLEEWSPCYSREILDVFAHFGGGFAEPCALDYVTPRGPYTYVEKAPPGVSLQASAPIVAGPEASPEEVHDGIPKVDGWLAPDTVQRIVRQSMGRFRACYGAGLRKNPRLSGAFLVAFVIDSDGAVEHAQSGGATGAGPYLPDNAVIACVVRSFEDLSFPGRDRGLVRVSYPLEFGHPVWAHEP